MHAVDPLAGKIGERQQIFVGGEPARFEAAHLARRRRASCGGFAADDPAHRGIMAQTPGVVHIFVSGETPEHRLSHQTDESILAVLACAGVGEHLARHRAEAERVVEFAVGEQSRVRSDHQSAKLEHQPAVEIAPQNVAARFTRWVKHARLDQ